MVALSPTYLSVDNEGDSDDDADFANQVIWLDNACQHTVLKRGFEIEQWSSGLTSAEWGAVRLLCAVAAQPIFRKRFDEIQHSIEDERYASKSALSPLGYGHDQLNVTYTKRLVNKHNKAGGTIVDLNRELSKAMQCAVDVGALVTHVDGFKDRMHPHLQRVARETLTQFVLDDDLMMVITNYRLPCPAEQPKEQPRHGDNDKQGSFFSAVMFGCTRTGGAFNGQVPCTRVLTYPNICSVSMNGEGWPMDWYSLDTTTPNTVNSTASIVVTGNTLHFGPGQPEEVPPGLDLRCALFRMARHPACKAYHDKFGDIQMFEWSYLASTGRTDLLNGVP